VRESSPEQRQERTPMSEEDPLDFTAVYRSYHDKVVAYAARLVGREEADDIAQEVFVKVGRSLAGLEDPNKLASWIFTITLNTVRDASRRKAVRPTCTDMVPDEAHGGEDQVDPLAQIPDAVSRSPEEVTIRSEMVDCYLDFVEQLPQSYREVYALSELADLSGEEIARHLSITLATVKIRLHRARTRLYEDVRSRCHCYLNERGELMGTLKER
jgi:RNA polymerase sigma-70 factor, ECF subfamily